MDTVRVNELLLVRGISGKHYVFDILKIILNAGTGIPGSLSNGDLSPFYLLLWNEFLYCILCLCWYSEVELGQWVIVFILMWLIGQWVADSSTCVCCTVSIFWDPVGCQRKKLAKPEGWFCIICRTFFVLEG